MDENVSTPPADAPIRTPSRSPENRWFWWGMAWGGAASIAGGATAYLHWRSEAVLRSGWHGAGVRADALGDSLWAAVLGLPITVFCSVVFLVSWALWIGEVRNRRQGGTGGMW
jgi:hypothetical protein